MSPRTVTPTAAFVDRDGTLIRDTGYVSDPDDVVLLPGVGEAVRLLNAAEVPVIIVTNQSGIGRGYFGVGAFLLVQARLEELLAAEGARIDAAYFCPHAPDEGCPCRKPGLELYQRAAAEQGVDPAGAAYVGDRLRDVTAAGALGGLGVLVARDGATYDAPVPPDVVQVPDLLTGVREILALPEGRS